MDSNARTATPSAPSAAQLMNSLLEAAGALRERLEAALQTVGLSIAKYDLLLQLSECDELLPLSELAAGQRCAASNITQLVDRLEADGLVRRVDDPADRRCKRAALTELGEERQAAGARQVERVHAEFATALAGADRAALARTLAALKGH